MIVQMKSAGSGESSEKDLRVYYFTGSAETITCDAKIGSLIIYQVAQYVFQESIAVLHPGETYNDSNGVDVITFNSDGKTIVRTGRSKNFMFIAVME